MVHIVISLAGSRLHEHLLFRPTLDGPSIFLTFSWSPSTPMATLPLQRNLCLKHLRPNSAYHQRPRPHPSGGSLILRRLPFQQQLGLPPRRSGSYCLPKTGYIYSARVASLCAYPFIDIFMKYQGAGLSDLVPGLLLRSRSPTIEGFGLLYAAKWASPRRARLKLTTPSCGRLV